MNVKHLLRTYEELESRRFNGDLVAVETLIDLEYAIDRAGLSARQRHYIHDYYVLGYTGDEIGIIDGVGRQAVRNVLKRAEDAIQKIYDKWEVAENAV